MCPMSRASHEQPGYRLVHSPCHELADEAQERGEDHDHGDEGRGLDRERNGQREHGVYRAPDEEVVAHIHVDRDPVEVTQSGAPGEAPHGSGAVLQPPDPDEDGRREHDVGERGDGHPQRILYLVLWIGGWIRVESDDLQTA